MVGGRGWWRREENGTACVRIHSSSCADFYAKVRVILPLGKHSHLIFMAQASSVFENIGIKNFKQKRLLSRQTSFTFQLGHIFP
jgi:hypothetical protein